MLSSSASSPYVESLVPSPCVPSRGKPGLGTRDLGLSLVGKKIMYREWLWLARTKARRSVRSRSEKPQTSVRLSNLLRFNTEVGHHPKNVCRIGVSLYNAVDNLCRNCSLPVSDLASP